MRETAHSYRKSTEQRRLRSSQKIHTSMVFSETKRQADGTLPTDSMSELFDAVQKEEWEKMMVRRLLEAVWYLKRI